MIDLDIGEPRSEFSGDAYARFRAMTLKRGVDREFRTLSGPGDTAVMGSSMGGLMAFYVMAEYPHLFGQAAAVSMHVALAQASEEGIDP